MFLLSSVVCVVFLQSATGDPYCSLSDILIDCVPCSENCMNRNQVCYLCPMQCAKSNNCKRVCEPTCLNQTCEYLVSDSVPVCTRGCIDGLTGRQCQDYCPEGCKTCDQETGQHCTSCWEGLEGQHCNTVTILSSTSIVHYPLTSIRECAEDCENCKDGNNCEDPCDCNGLTTPPLVSITTEQPGSGYKRNSFAEADAAIATAAAVAAVAVVAVVAAVVAVVICIATVCMYRKMRSRLWGRDRTTNYNPDGSSLAFTGYTYMATRQTNDVISPDV